MEINRETLKKTETWMVLAPVILLLLGLLVMYNTYKVRISTEAKVRSAKKVVENAKELLTLSKQARLNLSGSAAKEQFETVESMNKCAEVARIPEGKINRLTGEKGKTLSDGREVFRERYELNGVRMEQIGSFIDYAETNFESLRCVDIAITPSANKTAKDSWNTTLQFEHVK